MIDVLFSDKCDAEHTFDDKSVRQFTMCAESNIRYLLGLLECILDARWVNKKSPRWAMGMGSGGHVCSAWACRTWPPWRMWDQSIGSDPPSDEPRSPNMPARSMIIGSLSAHKLRPRALAASPSSPLANSR